MKAPRGNGRHRSGEKAEKSDPFSRLTAVFRNLGIRNKLLVLYSAVIFLAITLSGSFIYSSMKRTIERNIESELKNSTTTILNMVRTAAAVSLKNYLRAVGEKNREIIAGYHRRQLHGLMSEGEAQARAADVILRQTIGKSGYIYCINSDGVLVVHPKKPLQGVNISEHAFAREQMLKKQGYLEYDWKNPGEDRERPKALYMIYFEPWDWIISVSSYRKEFHELVNVDDFRESILSLQFGATGYSYVMDTRGNLVIHPKLEQQNIISSRDADGRFFIREICRRKSGKITYPWRNPGERTHREKLVIFNYIPEFDWIVASSSYLEEFYAPLRTMREITLIAILFCLLLAVPVIVRISSSITTPLNELMKQLEKGAGGNFSVRVTSRSRDEVGQLAAYFNSFMGRLEKYSTSLREEIWERKQAERALKHSEEMFFKAFNASPNAISITTLREGRFINVNDSFLSLTGFRREAVIGRSLADVRLFSDYEEAERLLNRAKGNGRVRNVEVEFLTVSGEPRIGVLSAEVIELWQETYLLSNIADVTDTRRLEKDVMAVSEKERQRIGQDLHDDLGPHLIGIEALVQVLGRKLEERSPPDAPLADKIRELIRAAIGKTRNLTRGLLPVQLVDRGLEHAIGDLVRRTREVYGVRCAFTSDGAVGLTDNTVATHLFYIVQEALHNAVKHAQASEIRVDLARSDGRILVRIIDDGRGLPEQTHGKGMGLRIMGYRAKMIQATLEMDRSAAGGTQVSIAFKRPLDRGDIGYG